MKDTTPIYFHSATYAYEHGELDQYHASHKANIACREAIEQAITDNYRDNRLGTACVQQVLQQFDPGRIFYVLANTVWQKDYDGRISRDNKAWAQTVPVCEDKDGFGYDRNVCFAVDRLQSRTYRPVSLPGQAGMSAYSGTKALCPRQPKSTCRTAGSA